MPLKSIQRILEGARYGLRLPLSEESFDSEYRPFFCEYRFADAGTPSSEFAKYNQSEERS